MPRALRVHLANHIYHVINRANARVKIFNTEEDYGLFTGVLHEARERVDMRILSYCIMPNHWHFALYPKEDTDLVQFMQWLTMTHTQRWHAAHKTIGSGHLYQGRYKSFIVQEDTYCHRLMVYIEQNPLRAKLVKHAQKWQWGSLYHRYHNTVEGKHLLSPWPIPEPDDYLTIVNTLPDKEHLESIRNSVNKGKPFGSMEWVKNMVKQFGLEITTRNRGRPKKGS